MGKKLLFGEGKHDGSSFVRADQIAGSQLRRMVTLCAAIGLYALKRAGQC